MGESKPKHVEKEGNYGFDYDDTVQIAKVSKAKAVKEEKPDDDEDNVPLAVSKSKKKKSTDSFKANKEEFGEDDDTKDKKKKDGGKSKMKPLKVEKKAPEVSDSDSEDRKKKEVKKSDAKPSKVNRRDLQVSDNVEEEDHREERKKRNNNKREEDKKVAGKKSKGSGANGKGKKEKKVFELPGQKHDPPEERDPLRLFYESLHTQVPNSEMAAFWMMEWGLLPFQEAKKVYERKLEKAQQQNLGSPVKEVTIKKTPSVSKTENEITSKSMTKVMKARKASKSDADESDDDFISSKKKIKRKVSI